MTDKMNRAVAALTGALITYFTLTFLEGFDFSVIVELLFGSKDSGYVSLHSLILIVGMMFIVRVTNEAGVFQFIAVLAIKLSKGKPIALMVIFCLISVFFSAILNNILTVMILIPLTITVSRILKIDPTPYILTQAILVNIGGTFFAISSIPNILIVTSTNISFMEFFLNLGLFSIVTVILSIIFFIFLYKPNLVVPRQDLVDALAEFNVWNVVQSPALLYASMGTLSLLMVCFIAVPPSILPPSMIALSFAMVLTIISKLDAKEIMEKFDLELLFYLLGVFVIAGGLEIVNVIAPIGDFLKDIGGGDPLIQILLILWFSAFLSSTIDNIPITKVLIPIVGGMAEDSTLKNTYYYSLSLGANWGDNLTPMGDNILVLNLAAQNKHPISMKTFWKLGFVTTLYQLILASIYFILILQFTVGIAIVGTIIALLTILFVLTEYGPENVQQKLKRGIEIFRKTITA